MPSGPVRSSALCFSPPRRAEPRGVRDNLRRRQQPTPQGQPRTSAWGPGSSQPAWKRLSGGWPFRAGDTENPVVLSKWPSASALWPWTERGKQGEEIKGGPLGAELRLAVPLFPAAGLRLRTRATCSYLVSDHRFSCPRGSHLLLQVPASLQSQAEWQPDKLWPKGIVAGSGLHSDGLGARRPESGSGGGGSEAAL